MLIKTYRLRLYVLYIVPLVLMVGLVARLYWLQVVKHEFYQKFADGQHYQKHTITPTRGKIFDANGHELAGSVLLDVAYVQLMLYPKENMREGLVPDLAHKLSQVLKDLPDKRGTSYDEVLARLKGKGSKVLARGIDSQMRLRLSEAVDSFREDGLPGNFISFEPENKRRYSRGSLAPHVVGYTVRDETGDNKGVDGVEKIYDEYLRGRTEKYVTKKSATGKPMEPADPELLESTFGNSVKLTINESIQAVTQNVLAQGVEKSMADSGVAICYHVKTGEVLAMANYPSYSLTDIGTASGTQRRNRALTDPIEPGSVMKIITFTSLFDAGKSEPFDLINCENGSWTMPNGRHIKDSHSDGVVPVSQVFQYSSNIGTIKAAREFDHKTFYKYLTENFGFGSKTGIDLPGENPGVLRHYKEWSGLSMSSLPMGYEIQMTAIQVAAAVGAVANKGAYMKPHVVKEILDHNGTTIKRIEPQYVREVADPASCSKIVDMMELVVEKGTAKAAKLDGYRVGGKTGTTKKIAKGGGGYGKGYIASFCGIAPIEDPEVCIYVYVDNPRGTEVYGGQVAAPVFREIAREAMRVLNIPERRAEIPQKDFAKALEKVRNKIEGRAPVELLSFQNDPDENLSPDAVPDLVNLSLAEAVKKAAEHGLEVEQHGSGIVIEQSPQAGETIEGSKVIKVTMANQQQSIRRRVDQMKEWTEDETEPEVAAAVEGTSEDFSSSVPLSLRVGGDSIPVAVDVAPVAPWVSTQGRKQPAAPEETPYPDLDEFAQQGKLDPKGASKSWQNFNKEFEEQRKRAEAETSVAEPEAEDAEPAKPSTVPVPEIDGTEDFDPTVEDRKPINIQTPKRTPKPAPSAAEHMYNL